MTNQPPKKNDYLEILSESFGNKSSSGPPQYTVADLLEADPSLELCLVAGKDGISRPFSTPKVQLLGLALAGYTDDLEPGSAQVLGRAELRYIKQTITEDPPAFFDSEFKCDIACFLVPESLKIPMVFAKKADRFKVPVLRSSKSRFIVESGVVRVLEKELAPKASFHAVFAVVCGLGILILGKSGIGKTDCALDLITHGHQLVADDIVTVRKNPLGQLVGKAEGPVRHHMNVRGLGIVNVKELFSVYSVMDEHTIDLAIYLEPWEEEKCYAMSDPTDAIDILGVEKPLYRMPVSSGRNWVNLIQVAVRRHILQMDGYDAEKALTTNLSAMLRKNG